MPSSLNSTLLGAKVESDDGMSELLSTLGGDESVGTLSTQPFVASSGTSSPSKGKCKAARQYKSCNVCLSEDMATGMKQCKKQNRTVRQIIVDLENKPEETTIARRDA